MGPNMSMCLRDPLSSWQLILSIDNLQEFMMLFSLFIDFLLHDFILNIDLVSPILMIGFNFKITFFKEGDVL